MNEQQIREALVSLGVDAAHWRVVVLLPLVQVAWADDTIQDGERRTILKIAAESGLVDDTTAPILERWLSTQPSESELHLGRQVLVALAHRQRGLGQELTPESISEIEALCVEVARSAGGLFGGAFSMSAEERIAIASITADFNASAEEFLELLPTPKSGEFETLF